MVNKLKYLYNAHFYNNAKFNPNLTGLLIDRDRIVKLCFKQDKISPDWEMINLDGAYVYPGFIDSHTHSFSGGIYLSGIDLSECNSIAKVLEYISNALKDKQQCIFAWRFDEEKIAEKRFPTMKELDSVCPDRPLLLRRIDGHSCILNSRARAMISGIKSSAELLFAEDNDLAVNWLQDNLSEEEIIEAYKIAANTALKGGFTTVHTMIGDAQMSNQHFKLICDHLNDFPISFELYPQSFNIKDALELGAKRIGGCILADGSIGSHTAAMTIPYRDKDTKGILYHNDDFWRNFVSQAHKNHLQVAVHCIGDAAIHQINSAFATQDKEEVKELRDELIHCEVTPDSLIQEIAASGAVAVMQPAFDLLWGGNSGLYSERLGERYKIMNRFRTLSQNNITVCGSSDWYVTEMNIAMSLYALIHHHNPEERITPKEAIKIYTENNSWLNHNEESLGLIEEGYIADLSVMDTDFTNSFDWDKVQTLFIMKKGNIVYESH